MKKTKIQQKYKIIVLFACVLIFSQMLMPVVFASPTWDDLLTGTTKLTVTVNGADTTNIGLHDTVLFKTQVMNINNASLDFTESKITLTHDDGSILFSNDGSSYVTDSLVGDIQVITTVSSPDATPNDVSTNIITLNTNDSNIRLKINESYIQLDDTYPKLLFSDSAQNNIFNGTGGKIQDYTYEQNPCLDNQVCNFTGDFAYLNQNIIYFQAIVECIENAHEDTGTCVCDDGYTEDTDSTSSTFGECIEVNNSPDDPTTIVSPAHTSTTNDNTPTLSTDYSDQDADPGYTNYRISTGLTGQCIVNQTVVASGSSSPNVNSGDDTSWPSDTVLADGTYYWCAQNVDEHDAKSDWVGMGSFTVDAYHEVTFKANVTDSSMNAIQGATSYMCNKNVNGSCDAINFPVGTTNASGELVFNASQVQTAFGNSWNDWSCELQNLDKNVVCAIPHGDTAYFSYLVPVR